MSNINDLPPEIIYQILLVSEYEDVRSYCRTSKFAHDLCSDVGFWIEKLDYELEYKDSEGYIIKPSHHIVRRVGIDIYRKWKIKDLTTHIRAGHNEIIFWMMYRYILYWTLEVCQYVVNLAAGYNNKELMLKLEGLKFLPDRNGTKLAARNGHLDILVWLDEEEFFHMKVILYMLL